MSAKKLSPIGQLTEEWGKLIGRIITSGEKM